MADNSKSCVSFFEARDRLLSVRFESTSHTAAKFCALDQREMISTRRRWTAVQRAAAV
jgi:hypothetical protein